MKSALKHAGRTVVGMVPAAFLVRLGVPALVALVFLAVLMLGVICWIINSSDRSDRVTRMIFARHGNATCLEPKPPAPSPASRGTAAEHWWVRGERTSSRSTSPV